MGDRLPLPWQVYPSKKTSIYSKTTSPPHSRPLHQDARPPGLISPSAEGASSLASSPPGFRARRGTAERHTQRVDNAKASRGGSTTPTPTPQQHHSNINEWSALPLLEAANKNAVPLFLLVRLSFAPSFPHSFTFLPLPLPTRFASVRFGHPETHLHSSFIHLPIHPFIYSFIHLRLIDVHVGEP
jgi:hypothetical protein